MSQPSLLDQTFPHAGTVLIADDEDNNRILLRDALEGRDYRVLDACDGVEALEVAMNSRPDVILLDWMMPKIDGLEVCRRLKANPSTSRIPVLMVTALSDRRERLSGIQAGANDYLVKPIDIQDVALRVRNAVHMKRLSDQIERNLLELQRMQKLRENLTHMIVHDLRAPLGGIMGFLELLRLDSEGFGESTLRHLDMAYKGLERLAGMITSILDVSRLEAGEMPVARTASDLEAIIQSALEPLSSMFHRFQMRFDYEPGVRVLCDTDLIRRVVGNLMSNAFKFTPPGGTIEILTRREAIQAVVTVRDSGPGIPPEFHGKIFEKFGQVENQRRKHSSGLGLTFCKLAVEANGGTIGVESEPGKGSAFRFTLPIAE
jgi:two-component system sensor histidine kinase/response regulator